MSEKTNRLAVMATGMAVLNAGWFFREQAISDQGIDAHLEKFTLDVGHDGRLHETGTGRLIAVQIKGGKSYFKKPSKDGWWFRFDEKKQKLWINHALPVIVILVDVRNNKLYWQRISPKTIVKAGKGFKVNVPESQTVAGADEAWIEMASGLELKAESRFEYSLLHLPPSVASMLGQSSLQERADAALLAMHLAHGRGNPRGTVSSLLATSPSWIESNPSWGWPVVGQYAIEHTITDLAAEALERAADRADGKSRSRLLASAAVLAHSSDRGRAAALLVGAQEAADADGGDAVMLAVAKTVMSRPSDDPVGWEVDPLLLSESEDVRGSAPAQRTLSLAARQRGDVDGAVVHGRAALEADESSTETMSLLASHLLARWSGSAAAGEDLDTAVSLLRALIAQRHAWAGPMEFAQEQLANALFVAGRLEETVEMTLPPPEGKADPADLQPRCLRTGARAAHRLGRADAVALASSLLGEEPLDRLTKQQVGALHLNRDEAIELRSQALETAIAEKAYEEIAAHGMALISEGVDVRERLRPYVEYSIFPTTLLPLASALLTARADLDAALPELRELARTNAIAAEHLIALLRQSGRHREAAAEAGALYELTRSEAYLIQKADALIAAQAGAEAVAAAEEAVAHIPAQPFEIARLLTFLGAEAADRRDWARSETYLSRVLSLTAVPSADQVWRLVSCLISQGRIAKASKIVDDYKPRVRHIADGWLWYHSHATMRWNQRTALDAYALAERFNDPKLSSALVNHIIQGTRGGVGPGPAGVPQECKPDGEVLGNIPPADQRDDDDLERRRKLAQLPVPGDLHRSSFELMGKLFEEYGEAAGFTILKGSPEELIEQVIERLRPNAEADGAIMDLARQTREGHFPVGFMAGMLGKSLASFVLQRVLGLLAASSPGNDEHDIEVKAASGAIGGHVAVDTTTMVTLTALEAPQALSGRFVSLLVPPATMHDCHRAVFDIQSMAGSPGTLGWNSPQGKPTLTELGEAQFARLWHRAERLEAQSDRVTVSSFAERHLGLEFSEDPAHSPWADVLELAADRGVPIWSDDLALRRLARSLNIQAFGTEALVDAIRDAAFNMSKTRESDDAAIGQAAASKLALARDFVVDLPISCDEVLQLAAEDEWKAGCAATILSRPAWWAGNRCGVTTLRFIYQQVKAIAPGYLPAWQFAAMSGVARSLPPVPASRVLAALALMGFGDDSSDQQLADGLRRAREIAADLGHPDPAGTLRAAARMKADAGECEDPLALADRVLAIADAQPADEEM